MKKFLLRYESFLSGAVKLLLALLVLVRICMAWPETPPVDTRYFVETSKLVLQGLSPYRSDTNTTIYKYPLQAPSMSLICMPLCFIPEKGQNILFFACGVLTFFGFTALVFHYFGYDPRVWLRNRWRHLPVWIAVSMICISSPFMLMLRHGQNASVAALLLFAALFYPARDKGANILLLGFSASMKYSLLTMQAPVLLIQKRWRLGVMGFCLFAVMVLSVGLWLDGIIPTLRDYILLLANDISRGANSYSNMNSFQFVHVGFFRCDLVNKLMKVLMLALYAAVLVRIVLRIRKKGTPAAAERLTAVEWGAFTMTTMAISYHRAYDGVLFLPFLGVMAVDAFGRLHDRQRSSGMRLVCALLLLAALIFWAVPQGLVFSLENDLGTALPMGEKLFLYAHAGPKRNLFPLYKIVTLVSSCLLLLAALLQPAADPPIGPKRENGDTP